MKYHVTLTWNGVEGPTPKVAALRFQQMLGVVLPEGTVLDVVNDETGEETEVEL